MLKRFKGCLIGLAIGDYLGMPVEFMSKLKVQEYFGDEGVRPVECYHRGGKRLPAGYYTDDTSLAICLAESLIEVGFDVKHQFLKYKKWYQTGHATPFGEQLFGIGQNTLKILMLETAETLDTEFKHAKKKGGNGALMRCSPLGLFYHQNEKKLVENTLKSTIITHNNGMAVWTSIAHNVFISYALQGFDKAMFSKLFVKTYPEMPKALKELLLLEIESPVWLEIENTGYTLHTFAISFYSLMSTNNFENCVTKAISFGGDTDTQGAVAGALAGAYYGLEAIPTLWKETLLRYDAIENLALRLYSKVTKNKL